MPLQGWILCQKIEFWAPHPKKKKQSHLRILGPPPPLILGPHPIFWAPNGFWGPQIDPTPPIKCKTLQIWPTLKWFFRFFVIFFIFLYFFFNGHANKGAPKSQFFRLVILSTHETNLFLTNQNWNKILEPSLLVVKKLVIGRKHEIKGEPKNS